MGAGLDDTKGCIGCAVSFIVVVFGAVSWSDRNDENKARREFTEALRGRGVSYEICENLSFDALQRANDFRLQLSISDEVVSGDVAFSESSGGMFRVVAGRVQDSDLQYDILERATQTAKWLQRSTWGWGNGFRDECVGYYTDGEYKLSDLHTRSHSQTPEAGF